MSLLISIIIPIYKVEPYLRECVESVINQTYKDIEIILVDDGSPDNCGTICDEYINMDARVRVIHKENGGLSDARNAGLSIARGEYIGFVDSDDWIAEDMYESLYKNIIENDADIAICGINYCYKMFTDYSNKNKYESVILDKEEAIRYCFDKNERVGAYAWNKLYKRYLFENIRYPYGKCFEDIYIITDLLLLSKRIVLDSSSKYNYRQRKSSIVGSLDQNKIMDSIEAHKRALQIVKSIAPSCTGSVRASLLYFHLIYLSCYTRNVKKCDVGFLKYNLKELRKNKFFILKNKHMKNKLKFHMFIPTISFPIYKSLCSLKVKLNKSTYEYYD